MGVLGVVGFGTHRDRRLALACWAIAIVVLAGCGDSQSSTSPVDRSSAVASTATTTPQPSTSTAASSTTATAPATTVAPVGKALPEPCSVLTADDVAAALGPGAAVSRRTVTSTPTTVLLPCAYERGDYDGKATGAFRVLLEVRANAANFPYPLEDATFPTGFGLRAQQFAGSDSNPLAILATEVTSRNWFIVRVFGFNKVVPASVVEDITRKYLSRVPT